MPDPQLSTRPSVKLAVKFKTLYGIGCVVDGVSLNALTYFALFYFTTVCGLSGTAAGAAVFISLIIDAVLDPAIGLLSDQSRSSLGRRHSFMFASIVPLGFAFGLLFSVPDLGGAGLFIFICGLSVVTRILLSSFNLPYYALGAELSDDYTERMSVVAYRITFLLIASFLSLALGLGLFFSGPNGLLDRGSYARYGWTCAAIMVFAGLVCAVGTRRVVGSLHVAPLTDAPILKTLWGELKEVRRSRSFLVLFFATLFFWIAQGVHGTLQIHAQKYFWNLSESDIKIVVLSIALGPLLGIPVAGFAAKRFEKKTIALAGLGLMAVSLAFLPMLRIMDVLTLQGPPLVTLLIVNALLTGAALVAAGISFQAMIADAADEHDYHFNVRREGLFFAGLTLAVKASTGVGALVAGLALDIIGFPAEQIAAQQSVMIGADTARSLGFVAGPLAAIVALLVPLVLWSYRLDRKALETIQQALRQRHLSSTGRTSGVAAE